MHWPHLQRLIVFGTFVLPIALLLTVVAFGQHAPVSLGADFCSDFPSAKPACGSFKELVDHRDNEILAILSQRCRIEGNGLGPGASGGDAYACFVENEDRFMVIGFRMPASREEVRGAGRGILCFDEYKKGMPGDYQRHTELVNDPLAPPEDKPTAMSPTMGETNATVDPSGITVSYSFPNGNGGKTDYKLVIRRSTKRFVETYEADKNTYTETGHCAEFPPK
jgi:hypothetical protein